MRAQRRHEKALNTQLDNQARRRCGCLFESLQSGGMRLNLRCTAGSHAQAQVRLM